MPRSASAPELLLNGRFLSRPMTGVDRTALNLSLCLARLANKGEVKLSIALPADAPDDQSVRSILALPSDCPILRSRLKGYLWEQFALLLARPKAVLLNLCNTGPSLRTRQLVLMHDAQVFDAPDSYSRPFRLVYRLLQPLLGRRSLLLATVSDHSRWRLSFHGIGKARQIHVLSNAADHMDDIEPEASILDHANLQQGQYMLTIGSAAPHKNISVLLQAMTSHAPLLVIAGGGPAVAAIVAKYPGENVVHLGRVSDGELKALYQGARMFLFPSITEGFGLPPLEAMACGCPVVASNRGAIPEVCGDAAVYCDAQDAASWTRAFNMLNRKPEQRDELIRRGRARAAQFSWMASATQVVRLVRTAAIQADNRQLRTDFPGASRQQPEMGEL